MQRERPAAQHGHGELRGIVVDTTAPAIDVPATITAEATSAAGASVSFSVSATDKVDGTVPVACDHASGSTFPVGTTTVQCTATDAAGNQAAAGFDVMVTALPVDTSAPVLSLPAPISVNAAVPSGALVGYTVSALDAVDGTVPVLCSQGSGTLFTIGTTTVTCTARDASGNEARGSFTVQVKGAKEQLETLLAQVTKLNLGPGSSIANKLHDALAALEPLAPGATCLILTDIEQLASAQSGKKLTVAQADWLRAELSRRSSACSAGKPSEPRRASSPMPSSALSLARPVVHKVPAGAIARFQSETLEAIPPCRRAESVSHQVTLRRHIQHAVETSILQAAFCCTIPGSGTPRRVSVVVPVDAPADRGSASSGVRGLRPSAGPRGLRHHPGRIDPLNSCGRQRTIRQAAERTIFGFG